MSLLQLKQLVPKRTEFFLKLVLLSMSVHILLLLFCFISFKRQHRLVINAHLTEAPVTIMPFVKHVGSTSVTATLPKKKETEKPSTVFKEVKKVEPKKTEQSTEAPKKDEAKKQEPKKQEEKQVESPKKEQPTKVEPPKPTTAEQPIQVGRYDFDELQLATELKSAIEQAWQRPAGYDESVHYRVTLQVGKDGNVIIVQEESSQALALDTIARNFVLAFEFPKKVWGRELEVIL